MSTTVATLLHQFSEYTEALLRCADVPGEAKNDNEYSFECFQRKLRWLTLEAKRKKTKNQGQIFLRDSFKQSSS